jgi:hypothetical protein
VPADEPTAPRGSAADRLDLDDLDPLVDLGAAVDLDVVGDDGPTASQRLGAWLDDRGITPFVRRHRAATAVATVAVVGLAAFGGATWARRSADAQRPQIVAHAEGTIPTLAEIGPDGQATQVQQDVALTIGEPPGTGVVVIGLTGPGLAATDGLPLFVAEADRSDVTVTTRGALACGTTADAAALAQARDVDYRVVVRRNRPDGTAAQDSVPLVGGQQLLDLVRSTCLQRAADHDLHVVGMSIRQVPGRPVLRLALDMTTTGDGTWTALQIADAARPTLVPVGEPLTVVGGQPATVNAELRPADCADPGSTLSSGVLLSASPPGAAPPGGIEPPVTIPLPRGLQIAVADSVRRLCGHASASVDVATAIMRTGSRPGTGGTLDLEVQVTTRGSSTLRLVPSTTAAGRVTPQEQAAVAGSRLGPTRVTWELPPCAALVESGLPQLHVELRTTTDSGRVTLPYLVPLRGETLGVALNRLCPDVAPEIRALG